MRPVRLLSLSGAIGAATSGVLLLATVGALAQPSPDQGKAPQPPMAQGTPTRPPAGSESTPSEIYGKLLSVPVTALIPGAVPVEPDVKNPVANDSAAAQRGMRDFIAFNCVGCHAANGAGGMGPALSNAFFVYGAAPENIYLTIAQGRPNGMPAWGSILPDEVIWDLVAYIKSISKEPKKKEWGTTVSATSPDIEQVPAEFQSTPSPWDYTQKFKSGQKP